MIARSRTTSPANRPARKSRVTLVAPVGEAAEVVATGDFTNWSSEGIRLKRRRDGAWSTTLHLLPGRYEYRLLVDGHWGNNPAAPEHSGNQYGSENDVLTVP
jgi:1,4-alpha-glucan branching enzyme